MACEARFQIGLVSGECALATLQLEEREIRTFVGGAVEQAEAVARQAAPGSIRISPETYARVHVAVGSVASWMLTSEYDGETMTSASLTPPPRPSSALSTFAGLGLT
jgi:class 3 adenylate cyclase